ncbi:MAG: SOS response-associated peptidase [Oscillospiraceae bacterium]|jgi:putative SOS response-associated peptidase YedK|nr:SOS response-associated peptidase [Oscillospiraceae bacterium]
MCGRYFIADPETDREIKKICDDINFRYQSADRSIYTKTGEIFPTDPAPVLVHEKDAVTAVRMTWGFPAPQRRGVIINARAETAADKPMFRGSVPRRRCIVPASGFFEWAHEGEKSGTKYLLTSEESKVLFLAGLYSIFEKPEGERYAAFVILTVDANDSVRKLHDRMPLIIPPKQDENWLADESYARMLLLSPCASKLIGTEA